MAKTDWGCVEGDGRHDFAPFTVPITIDPRQMEISIDTRGGTARFFPFAGQMGQEMQITCQRCALTYTLLSARLAATGIEFILDMQTDGARLRVSKPVAPTP